jgi:hypothetical protein
MLNLGPLIFKLGSMRKPLEEEVDLKIWWKEVGSLRWIARWIKCTCGRGSTN